MNSEIDPEFLNGLMALVDSDKELTFERRGEGASIYSFHGKVVSVNAARGTLKVLRTRTHKGEIHEMGLRYFLTATRPSGELLVNRLAVQRNNDFQQRRQAREIAVEQACSNPLFLPPKRDLRSRYTGTSTGTLEGYPKERYVFHDKKHPARIVGLIAESADTASHFMAMQDLFMPLEDMFWHAVRGKIIWPAWIAFERRQDPVTWSVDWLSAYAVLQGIPKAPLGFYMERFNEGRYGIRSFAPLTEDEVQALKEKGLLQQQSAKRFRLKPPLGLSDEGFRQAVRELRHSIYIMRQWLRAIPDFYGEDQLELLVGTA